MLYLLICKVLYLYFFFFSSRRRHTRSTRDWSSDMCSSDLNELERRAAEVLGQAEAVFVPTATMANEIALRALSEPGDELVAEENSHILLAELGGPAIHAGLMTRPLHCEAGRFTPEQLRA